MKRTFFSIIHKYRTAQTISVHNKNATWQWDNGTTVWGGMEDQVCKSIELYKSFFDGEEVVLQIEEKTL